MIIKLISNRIITKNIYYAIAKTGIFIGVICFLISKFIINGFFDEVDKKTRKISGDIILRTDYFSNEIFINPSEIEKILEPIKKDLSHCSFISYKSVILLQKNGNSAAILGEVDTHSYYFIDKKKLKSDYPQKIKAAVSESFAKANSLSIGDTITVAYFTDELINKKLEISELYKNVFFDIDEKLILISKEDYKSLEEDYIKTCKIFIKQKKNEKQVLKYLSKNLPEGINAYSIKDEYSNIYDWLNILKKSLTDFSMIIFFITILNIFIVGIMLFLESLHIFRMLLIFGATKIIMIKIIIKVVFRTFYKIILYANIFSVSIFLFLKRFSIPVNREVYYIDKIPVKIFLEDFFIVNAVYFLSILSIVSISAWILFSEKILSRKIW